MTSGIKLSSLSLRDGDNQFHSLKSDKTYIGDMLSPTASVTASSLKNYFEKSNFTVTANSNGNFSIKPIVGNGTIGTLENINGKNIHLERENNNLNLYYVKSNNEKESLGTIENIDTNTTYTFSFTKEENGNSEDGIYLNVEDNNLNRNSYKIPITEKDLVFGVENGIGIHVSADRQEGEGYISEYTSDGTTIIKTTIGDQTSFSLATLSTSSTTTTPATLNYGDSFTVITGIGVDNYGRVISFSTKTYTLPAAPVQPTAESIVSQYVTIE